MANVDENSKNPNRRGEEDGEDIYDERELRQSVLDEFSRPSSFPLNRGSVNPNLRSANNPEGEPPFPPPPPGAFPPPPFPPGQVPPFGFPPPPPPPFGFPPPQGFPPPPLPENMGIEYDENGNPVLVEYEFEGEEAGETSGGAASAAGYALPQQEPFGAREKPKGRKIAQNDTSVVSRQKEGFKMAADLEKQEGAAARRMWAARIILFLVFMAAATVAAIFVIDILFPQHDVLPDNVGPNKNLAGESYWKLEPSMPNNTVMRFYEAAGGTNKCGAVYDKMIWGSFHVGIRIEQFYCIEKRGIAYLKVGIPPKERIYLLNAEGLAKRLLTVSATGPSETLNEYETETLNSLVFFDEPLHKAAFVDYMSNRHPFKSLGRVTYNDNVYESIEYQALSGMKIVYYFDLQTSLLACKIVSHNGVSSRVEFQDYADYGGVMLPRVRNVYMNSDEKPYGTAIFDTVKFNRDIIFPR